MQIRNNSTVDELMKECKRDGLAFLKEMKSIMKFKNKRKNSFALFKWIIKEPKMESHSGGRNLLIVCLVYMILIPSAICKSSIFVYHFYSNYSLLLPTLLLLISVLFCYYYYYHYHHCKFHYYSIMKLISCY